MGAKHLVHEYIGGRLHKLRIAFVSLRTSFRTPWRASRTRLLNLTTPFLRWNGRVLVGHGYDNPQLAVVDVIVPETCLPGGPALVDDLAFPTVKPVGDLAAGEYVIALAPPDACNVSVGPVTAQVNADVATLLVASANAIGGVSVYALIGDFASGDEMTPIPTLPLVE